MLHTSRCLLLSILLNMEQIQSPLKSMEKLTDFNGVWIKHYMKFLPFNLCVVGLISGGNIFSYSI